MGEYNYDDQVRHPCTSTTCFLDTNGIQGQFFPFFVTALLLLILLPVTYTSTRRKQGPTPQPRGIHSSDVVVDGSPRIDCSCDACERKRQLLVSRQRRELYKPQVLRKYVMLAIGWGIVGFMAYRIATTKVENEIWDPYAILGISTSSSLDVIKSHYKKLSRTFHPDKIKLVGNMTKDIVEEKFVNLTKAYKAYLPLFSWGATC
jgi:translocation protein SEC63